MPQSILIVEDYPDLREAIAELLTRNDCVCDTVDSSGAIGRLRTKRYETIFIAPQVSIGNDPVLHFLIENDPAQLEHVVLMTSPKADEEATDARCRVLTKPFSREQLLAVLGDRRAGFREPAP